MSFIEKTFEDGRVNVDQLCSVIKIISRRLSLDNLHVENSEIILNEDLKGNFNVVNLSKRVEAVEEMTKNICISLDKLKQTESCLNQKLEETRIFLNKLQDQLDGQLNVSKLTRNDENAQNNVNNNNNCLFFDVDKLENISKAIETLKFSQVILDEKLEKITGNLCEMKQQNHNTQEKIDDLFFSSEIFENKIEEISLEVKEFNARINCVKCEVHKTVNSMKCLNEKIPKLDKRIQIINCEVEKRIVKQEAFDQEKKKFLQKNDIDSLNLKISSLSNELEKFQVNSNNYFLRLQNQIKGKLNSDELLKFKEIIETNFLKFIKELELLIKGLLLDMSKGVAGKFINFNCIACDSAMTMKNESQGIPKLQNLSRKFLMKTDKFKMKKCQSNPNFHDILHLFHSKLVSNPEKILDDKN